MYKIKFGGRTHYVQKKEDAHGNTRHVYLTFSCCKCGGNNPYPAIIEKIKGEKLDKKYIWIRQIENGKIGEYKNDGIPISLEADDYMIPQSLFNEVKNIIENFREFYSKEKLTILLHGKPGTGKTTLIRYIACLLGLPVTVINSNNVNQLGDVIKND